MKKVTQEDIIAIIKDTGVKLDFKKLNNKERLVDQGADSLDMMNIIFAIQEKYGIEITDESISDGKWLSIDKMIMSISELLEQK